jgi:hypothetical protein
MFVLFMAPKITFLESDRPDQGAPPPGNEPQPARLMLRYASEFFADVFTGKTAARRRKRFIAGLKELQVPG